VGGCATYGCSEAAQAEKPPVAQFVGGGWGDDKQCPACFARIPSSLLVCRCGARFPYADPMSIEAFQGWSDKERRRARTRKQLVLLFVFSLFGFTAPVLGAIAGFRAHKLRDELVGESGAYLALGYGTAALGACWAVIGLLLLAQ